jgi:hypothetical protein
MEGKNYLSQLLANSLTRLVMTHSSQNSAPLSSVPLSSISVASVSVSYVLIGPPHSLPRRAPVVVQERHWSNVVVKFLLKQCKKHVETHNTITMRSYQWARVHKLLITQFSQESGRKIKSLSHKWEKLRSTYSKIKKLRNQKGASVRDDGAKFIWYDQIDEILSLAAKANGVLRAMDQGVPVPGTGTSSSPTDGCEEANGDGEPSWVHSPQRINHEAHSGADQQSNDITPRILASNLVEVSGKGINFTSSKRARIDKTLMDSLDILADSTTEIERLRIKTTITMYKYNLIDYQENRKLELKMFRLQQASGEMMATMFAEVVKKILNRYCNNRSMSRELWFEF